MAHPRWRVGGPFAKAIKPVELAHQMARINGLFGGIAASESGVVSQAWFIGRVAGVPFEDFVGEGDACADEIEALNAGAIPLQKKQPPKPGKGAPNYEELGLDELEELILTGAHFFGPANELLRRMAYGEVPPTDAEADLRDLFDQMPPALQNRDWHKGRGSIGRWVQQVYDNAAKKKGTFLRKLIRYIDRDDRWRGVVRHNDFTLQTEVADPFPLTAGQAPTGYRPLLDPEDVLETLLDVQEHGFPTAGLNHVRNALTYVSHKNTYHPVRIWLGGLEWDGEQRVDKLFLNYFPGAMPDVTNPPLPEEIGRCEDIFSYYQKTAECFVVGAVQRIRQPGCKLDTLPVAVGPQNYGKSRGAAALVPDPEWFSDDVSTMLIDRDTKESLVGKWLLELAEFPHIRKEVEKVKAFFSRQRDRFRRAYGHSSRDWARQCVFFATTNELEFIDVTGNRRFWPIPLDRPVDVDAIARDCAQIWAEAMELARDGYEWWLPPKIEAIAAEYQAEYLEEDLLQEPIREWLVLRHPDIPDDPNDPNYPRRQCTPFSTAEVIEGLGYALKPGRDLLGYPRTVAARADYMRAAGCLKRLGYVRDKHKRTINGHRERFWQRIPEK